MGVVLGLCGGGSFEKSPRDGRGGAEEEALERCEEECAPGQEARAGWLVVFWEEALEEGRARGCLAGLGCGARLAAGVGGLWGAYKAMGSLLGTVLEGRLWGGRIPPRWGELEGLDFQGHRGSSEGLGVSTGLLCLTGSLWELGGGCGVMEKRSSLSHGVGLWWVTHPSCPTLELHFSLLEKRGSTTLSLSP